MTKKELYNILTEKIKNKLHDENDVNIFIGEDNIYDCHGWTSLIKDTNPLVEIFLFNEEKMDEFYSITDNEFFNSFMDGYFGYVAGHSFIKIDGVVIDLALDSEGASFEDVQSIGNELSKHTQLFY